MTVGQQHIRTAPPGSKPAAGSGKRLCVQALTDGHAGLLALGRAQREGRDVMRFDRCAILRAAHAGARHRLAANRAWRSYRQAFADALRREWQTAKFAAAQAAFGAEEAALPPLPADIAERISAIRADATYEPHTFAGHARFRALNDEADQIATAARLSMIPAQHRSHHAC